jgi:hypothetical protein
MEHLKKCYSHFGARIFGLWRGFGEGAGLKNPVTEPKRSQSPKRPLSFFAFPNGYNIFENALAAKERKNRKEDFAFMRSFAAIK